MITKDIKLVKSYFNETKFLNALYFASKSFYRIALNWLQNEKIDFEPSDRILQSLYKYYARMCCRCTPYGLFAGFAYGEVYQGYTNIELDGLIPKVRTDILFLKKIKDYIINRSANNDLPLFRNNTMYKLGNSWRYISWSKDYNYEISEISQDFILNSILSLAQSGTKVSEIKNFLNEEIEDISRADIEEYIELLIKNNILVDRLPPYMTSSEDPLFELENHLSKNNYNTDILKSIINFQNKINCNVVYSKEFIEKIDDMSKRFTDFFDESHQIYQIDTKISLKSNYINKKVTSLLSKRAEELIPIIRNSVDHKISNFTKKFHKKFETKEISLVKALDPDYGVGYDFYMSGNLEETPLLDDIYFTFKNVEGEGNTVSPLIKIILDKYIHNFSFDKFQPIILSEEDINNGKIEQDSLPSFGFNSHMFGSLICESQRELDEGNFKFLPSSPIPTANVNVILSRFAYHDNDLRKNLEAITEDDSDNCIFVELLHHREDRLANVLLRPNLYNYELPYVSESKSDKANVISINDIYIRYEEGKIKLRSKSLNKEIKTKYSNAYNYNENQLPIINFLGDYQSYGIDSGFNWDWGFLDKNSFLPRVEYKEFILVEARWKINKDKNITIEKLRKTIQDNCIPTICTIKKRDNILVLNTNNETCLHILAKHIMKEPIFIYEYLEPLKLPNKNGEQFASEFIFPFISDNRDNGGNQNPVEYKGSKKRKYIPGEDWSFYKIYTSHKYADIVIKEVLAKYVTQFLQTEYECPWHFIRYQDPDYHVRFRVKNRLSETSITYINSLLKELVDQGVVSSLEIDTYNRELERYGMNNIELSEKLFHYDSLAVLEFITINDDLNEDTRWKTAVLSLHLLMNDFGISLEDRIHLFDELFQTFMPENVDISNPDYVKKFKKSIEKKYKENRGYLDSVLRLNDYEEVNEYVDPFLKRSKNIIEISHLIKENVQIKSKYLNLIKDYVHMNMNRIFLTKARMHEFVIYFFMFRTYNSIYHRNDKTN